MCLEFAAAHHIRGYDGECSRPHGHNFKVEVEATTPRLNKLGIALDFKDLKRMTKALIDRFDHQDLNTVEPFITTNPTAETLAEFFFVELERQIEKTPSMAGLILKKISVWENDRSVASYGLI